jgi:hypothetical protein
VAASYTPSFNGKRKKVLVWGENLFYLRQLARKRSVKIDFDTIMLTHISKVKNFCDIYIIKGI